MRSFAVLLAAFGATAVTAAENYTSSLDMTLTNPGTVDDGERASWCTAQYNTCHLLCDDKDETNDCDYQTLKYDCQCSNNSAPGLQYYTQTLPTFICQTLQDECIASNAGSQDGQEACNKNIGDHCATQNPPKANSGNSDDDTASSTDSTASATSTASKTSEASAAASTTDAGGIAAPSTIPQRIAAVFAAGALIALV